MSAFVNYFNEFIWRFLMQQFQIVIRSLAQIQDFVRLAMEQPFDIMVGNDRQNINGKDIVGMFSLDYRYPIRVSSSCTPEEFDRFRQGAADFIAE